MNRLHHIALGARDVEAVASFYTRFCSLAERDRQFDEEGRLRSIWLDLEGSLLMIERTEGEPRPVAGIARGPFLLAFTVSSEARQRLEQELEVSGYAIEARTNFTTYTRDPEGNRVGFSHYPEPSR